MDLVLVYSRIEFSKENSREPKHNGGGAGLLELAISGQNGKPVRGAKWCRDSFDRVNFWGLKSRSGLTENNGMDKTGDWTYLSTFLAVCRGCRLLFKREDTKYSHYSTCLVPLSYEVEVSIWHYMKPRRRPIVAAIVDAAPPV